MRTFFLVDNGSRRAESTRNLRRVAAQLTARLGALVQPVSLLHSDAVPVPALDGVPARTLAVALRQELAAGARDFVLIPLFFGRSRALTQFIPETAAAVAVECGAFRWQLAPELCPLPDGEPQLVQILLDHVAHAATVLGQPPRRVVVVDHGSPLPEVTAVRHWLRAQLQAQLGTGVAVTEAVMERRAGAAYDFNGPLLETWLRTLAAAQSTPVIVALLFLAAGRHAGAGGDIAAIMARVGAEFPEVPGLATPLIGGHPLLIDILLQRVAAVTGCPFQFE